MSLIVRDRWRVTYEYTIRSFLCLSMFRIKKLWTFCYKKEFEYIEIKSGSVMEQRIHAMTKAEQGTDVPITKGSIVEKNDRIFNSLVARFMGPTGPWCAPSWPPWSLLSGSCSSFATKCKIMILGVRYDLMITLHLLQDQRTSAKDMSYNRITKIMLIGTIGLNRFLLNHSHWIARGQCLALKKNTIDSPCLKTLNHLSKDCSVNARYIANQSTYTKIIISYHTDGVMIF